MTEKFKHFRAVPERIGRTATEIQLQCENYRREVEPRLRLAMEEAMLKPLVVRVQRLFFNPQLSACAAQAGAMASEFHPDELRLDLVIPTITIG